MIHGLLLLLVVAAPWGQATGHINVEPPKDQSQPATDAPSISLVVAGFDPNGLLSLFGHSYFVVQMPDGSRPVAYSYQIYVPENDTGILPAVSVGRATMDLVAKDAQEVHWFYANEHREVRQTHLDLEPGEAWALAEILNRTAEEQGLLPYHMIYDNCSTRLRDLLDEALDGEFHNVTNVSSGQNVRMLAEPYLGHKVLTVQFWALLYGDDLDRILSTWELSFIPIEFEQIILSMGRENGTALGSETVILATTEFPPPGGGPVALIINQALGVAATLFSIFLGLCARQWLRPTERVLGVWLAFMGLLFGLCSAFILAAWDGGMGEHLATNQNILIATPLAFLLIPFGLMLWVRPERAWRLLVSLALASLALLAVALFIRFIPGVFDRYNVPFIIVAALSWGGLLFIAHWSGRVDLREMWRALREPRKNSREA